MSGKTASKETWKDWETPGVPEPSLLTRDELLALLERLGVKVEERRLRFWEASGVLPGPVRRFHEGATRALYPAWQVNLIFSLRHFQEQGYSLPELPARMRLLGRYLSLIEEMMTSQPADGLNEHWRMQEPPPSVLVGEGDFRRGAYADLYNMVRPWATWYHQKTATRILRAELTLTDEHGRAMTCAIELNPSSDLGE